MGTYLLWGGVAAVAAAILVRVKTELSAQTECGAPGLTTSTYILLTVFGWVAERSALRLAAVGPKPGVLDVRLLNGWAPFTLWWPPELLQRLPTVAWHARSAILAAIIAVTLITAVILSFLRLRNAALPGWIAIGALIPLVNLGLFLFLSVVPTRKPELYKPRDWVDFLMPREPLGSAVVSCVLTAVLGLLVAQFGVAYLGTYGWTLFTLVPVVMGFIAAIIYGLSEPRNALSCISVAGASVFLAGLALMGLALEGLICLVMAAPLALPLAALGGWLGYLVQRRAEPSHTPQIASALLLFVPFMMYGEKRSLTGAKQIEVSTGILIHAPADRVWQGVIHLASVPKPDSILFHSVAYPIQTNLEGTGAGATRKCVFSGGSIVEPIKVWNPGHELRFAVISQPPLMREMSPYRDVRPPHLKLEYLRSREGQFTLTPQADGSTVLTGTSYYESRLWPGTYWEMWTNGIAHRIHRVVLEEIKRQSEN